MTDPEVILWSRLRGRGGDRPTLRRQHPFGAIILDFYCPSLKLAIEVDGATHWDDDAQLRDARLNLIDATRQVLANGLGLLGVSAPETM